MQLNRVIPVNARSFDELPSAQTFADSIKQLAADLTALRSAPVLDANYSGPVLLVGQASAEMFARVLAPNLSGQRAPMTDRPGQQTTASSLVDRLNRPVLPSYLSVFDDPAEQRFGARTLIGHYDVDDQGVPARRVSLIEDGLLTNLLMSRRPGKDRLQSNGHGRSGYPGRETAQIGNLFVTANGGKGYDDLKKELIELAKVERLQYGVIIKALESGGRGAMGNPVLTYKVYVADGREELIRGASISGLSVQSLRHIQAAGNDAFVANRLTGSRGAETPVSVVAPSVLLEELEIERPAGTQQKPALLTHPFFPD
jgi:predicted Zn-dependent protease